MNQNRIDIIINRHMARILTDLEKARCSVVYKKMVKTGLIWMRSDINEMIKKEERMKRNV